MGRTYIVRYHPLPLHDWLHQHQRVVRSSFGAIVAILAIAIAAPTVSMVRDAIAARAEPMAQGTELAPTAELPREWSRSLEPITFDHMYRQGARQAGVSYTRDARHKYSNSFSD